MHSIYDELRNASNVSAYVIMSKKHGMVGKVVIRHTKSNASVFAYAHWLGTLMQKGKAGGYGYDRHSAAVAAAAAKAIKANPDMESHEKDFWNELNKDDGFTWDRRLQDAGFEVFQAV